MQIYTYIIFFVTAKVHNLNITICIYANTNMCVCIRTINIYVCVCLYQQCRTRRWRKCEIYKKDSLVVVNCESSIHLSVPLSIFLSICLPICLSIYLLPGTFAKISRSADSNRQQGAPQRKSKHHGPWLLALAKPPFWKFGCCEFVSSDFRKQPHMGILRLFRDLDPHFMSSNLRHLLAEI